MAYSKRCTLERIQDRKQGIYGMALVLSQCITVINSIPYTRNIDEHLIWRFFAVEPPTKILAVLDLATFPYA